CADAGLRRATDRPDPGPLSIRHWSWSPLLLGEFHASVGAPRPGADPRHATRRTQGRSTPCPPGRTPRSRGAAGTTPARTGRSWLGDAPAPPSLLPLARPPHPPPVGGTPAPRPWAASRAGCSVVRATARTPRPPPGS